MNANGNSNALKCSRRPRHSLVIIIGEFELADCRKQAHYNIVVLQFETSWKEQFYIYYRTCIKYLLCKDMLTGLDGNEYGTFPSLLPPSGTTLTLLNEKAIRFTPHLRRADLSTPD